jgi:hypothetical protein
VAEDYRTAKMPAVNTSLLEGELAWRQHDGGHEDRSNMSFFIAWANRLLHHQPPPVPADEPRMRADANSHLAHQQLLAKAKSGGIDVYVLGDSITRRWGALDYLVKPYAESFKDASHLQTILDEARAILEESAR